MSTPLAPPIKGIPVITVERRTRADRRQQQASPPNGIERRKPGRPRREDTLQVKLSFRVSEEGLVGLKEAAKFHRVPMSELIADYVKCGIADSQEGPAWDRRNREESPVARQSRRVASVVARIHQALKHEGALSTCQRTPCAALRE